jgi:hypothetical protein
LSGTYTRHASFALSVRASPTQTTRRWQKQRSTSIILAVFAAIRIGRPRDSWPLTWSSHHRFAWRLSRIMSRSTSALVNTVLTVALLLSATLAPVSAAPPASVVVDPPPCVPVATVSLSGPTTGNTNVYYNFSALAGPADCGLDLTFMWEVTDYPTTPSAPVADRVSEREYAWQSSGLKTIAVSAVNCSGQLPTAIGTWQIMVGPLPLADVPDDIRQRAALHLEEQRASGQSPEWAEAFLGDAVRPLFRPDLDAPAYYEFSVLAPGAGGGGASGAAVQLSPAGFIVVATGEHDYPIPNWATAGLPPSERMQQQAAANNDAATKFYKLDILSYAAEDDSGAAVAFDGDLPIKILDMPDEWLTNPPPIVETIARPSAAHPEDPVDASDPVDWAIEVINPVDNPLRFEPWDSWDAFKAEYAGVFEHFIAAQAAAAAPEWEIERHAREYGHVLFKGDRLEFPLLWPDPFLEYDGPVQALVNIEPQYPAGLPPRLRVTAIDTIKNESTPLTITVTYPNGEVETLNILIVYRAQAHLPVSVLKSGGEGPTPVGDAQAAGVGRADVSAANVSALANGDEGILASDGYTYWYATGATKEKAESQQAWYRQYMGDCKSGCGPTAWAMLIAWGDRQAAYQEPAGLNAIWSGRWGLYRRFGGRSDEDRTAPSWWNNSGEAFGVEQMTWEINRDARTWCNGFNDAGATWPTDMIEVVHYLNGRSGMEVKTWANPAGFDVTGSVTQSIREKARNTIQNPLAYRRPAIIGTGFLAHYPLAYGYRSKPMTICNTTCASPWSCQTSCVPAGLSHGFLVNQGWAWGYGEWVSANTWFAGRLSPHQSYMDDVAVYRPSARYWYLDYQHDAAHDLTRSPNGILSAIRPVLGDFDRDNVLDDLAMYAWADANANNRFKWHFDFGTTGRVTMSLPAWVTEPEGWPIALDADRDGWVDDIAVYVPTNKRLYIKLDPDLGTGYSWFTASWFPTDGRPVAGDFDSDGYHDDIAIYSPSTGRWYYDYPPYGGGIADAQSGPWGTALDLPIAGDFDKDGYADDIGLFNTYGAGDRKWRYDYNHDATNINGTNKTVGPYGANNDLPIAGELNTR